MDAKLLCKIWTTRACKQSCCKSTYIPATSHVHMGNIRKSGELNKTYQNNPKQYALTLGLITPTWTKSLMRSGETLRSGISRNKDLKWIQAARQFGVFDTQMTWNVKTTKKNMGIGTSCELACFHNVLPWIWSKKSQYILILRLSSQQAHWNKSPEHWNIGTNHLKSQFASLPSYQACCQRLAEAAALMAQLLLMVSAVHWWYSSKACCHAPRRNMMKHAKEPREKTSHLTTRYTGHRWPLGFGLVFISMTIHWTSPSKGENTIITSARFYSQQWTNLTTTQWHTDAMISQQKGRSHHNPMAHRFETLPFLFFFLLHPAF